MAERGGRKLIRRESQQILNESQVEELKMAFDMYDDASGGNGFLSKPDMKKICDKYGVKVSSTEADDMFKELDVTKDGKVGFPEFMSMMSKRMKAQDSADELLEAFRVFDPYGEGVIQEKELSEALLNSGDKLSKEELNEVYNLCLIDGTVNYKNFVNQIYGNTTTTASK